MYRKPAHGGRNLGQEAATLVLFLHSKSCIGLAHYTSLLRSVAAHPFELLDVCRDFCALDTAIPVCPYVADACSDQSAYIG